MHTHANVRSSSTCDRLANIPAQPYASTQKNVPASAASLVAQICARRQTIVNYLRRRCSCSLEDAEDLAQSTILNAIRSQHTFRSETNLLGWLICIARNVLYSEHGKRMRQAASFDAYAVLAESVEEKSFDFASCDQLSDRVERSLPADRVRLLIGFALGFSYLEIATSEGIPVGTVRSRINRARTALAEMTAHD